jgi:hypothetical protein
VENFPVLIICGKTVRISISVSIKLWLSYICLVTMMYKIRSIAMINGFNANHKSGVRNVNSDRNMVVCIPSIATFPSLTSCFNIV